MIAFKALGFLNLDPFAAQVGESEFDRTKATMQVSVTGGHKCECHSNDGSDAARQHELIGRAL